MLSPKEGAQTTLICATRTGVVKGGYYHNTMGQIILPINDAAVNVKNADEFKPAAYNVQNCIETHFTLNIIGNK